MLAEGFVAFIALVTIMIVASEAAKGVSPGKIYGNGIGNFLTLLIGRENLRLPITFGAMAFSTFVFDTLDVSLRLGRYIVQELFGLKGRIGAVVGTLATIFVPFICVLIAPKGSWNDFWTLFGASNQLLAALTLAFDYGLALSSAPAHRFYACADAFRAGDYALGFDESGHRKFPRRKRFRY